MCVAGEDRWPVPAPLAEGAQPGAGERTLDKRGGSEGKKRRPSPVLGGAGRAGAGNKDGGGVWREREKGHVEVFRTRDWPGVCVD